MAKGNRTLRLSWKQIGYAVALAILIWYAVAIIDVVRRGNEAQRVVEAMEADIAQLEQQQAELSEELEYMRSDAYVEQAAREELKYSEPGEVVLVPVPMQRVSQEAPSGSNSTPYTATPTPATTSPLSRWEELKSFFVRDKDDRP